MSRQKVICVSSASRLSGEPYNFVAKLNLPKGNKFTKMTVLEAQVPKSYYLFSSSDDRTLIVTETTGGLAITATIDIGNYSINTLIVEIQRALRAASVIGGNSLLYVVTYDDLLSNIVIYSGSASEQFDVTTTNAMNPYLLRVIGFDNPTPSYMSSSAGVLDGNDVVDLERTATITLASSVAQNYDVNEIACFYPDNYATNSMISYAPANPINYTCDVSNNNVSSARFELFDDQGKRLELGDDVRFKLLFWE